VVKIIIINVKSCQNNPKSVLTLAFGFLKSSLQYFDFKSKSQRYSDSST
jgi:hypothetical protein